MFDGLLYPIIALDSFILFLARSSNSVVPGFTAPPPARIIIAAIGLIVWLDYLIIRRVWRSVNKTAATDSIPAARTKSTTFL